MINKPAFADLKGKVPYRYMLVSVVAKRARQLVEQEDIIGTRKPVSYAVDELAADKLDIKYNLNEQ